MRRIDTGGAHADHVETLCVFQGGRQVLLHPRARHGRQGIADDTLWKRAQRPREGEYEVTTVGVARRVCV